MTYTCKHCQMSFLVIDHWAWTDNITRCAEGCGLAMADRDVGDRVQMVTELNEVQLVDGEAA